MEPVLSSGDTILVNRLSKGKPGDIIVLKNPEKNSKEKYLVKQVAELKEKEIFVVGLNKEKSIDSRKFGWIQRNNIIGKMILKLS